MYITDNKHLIKYLSNKQMYDSENHSHNLAQMVTWVEKNSKYINSASLPVLILASS